MFSKDPHSQKNAQGTPPQSASTPTKGRATSSRKVTEARATAQRTKLDTQAEGRRSKTEDAARARPSPGKRERERPGNRRGATIERAIADYLLDHVGGNHSHKTLEWHRTALTLMQAYLEEECKITMRAASPTAPCPCCGTVSKRVQSRYYRENASNCKDEQEVIALLGRRLSCRHLDPSIKASICVAMASRTRRKKARRSSRVPVTALGSGKLQCLCCRACGK